MQLSTILIGLLYRHQFRKQQQNKILYQDSFTFRAYLIEDQSLLPYITWLYLFFVALFTNLVLNEQILFPIKNKAAKQYIDIQLVSNTDFKNKQELLPATIPKLSLGRRVSPINSATEQNNSIALVPKDTGRPMMPATNGHHSAVTASPHSLRPPDNSAPENMLKHTNDSVYSIPFVIHQLPNRKQKAPQQNEQIQNHPIQSGARIKMGAVLPMSSPFTPLPHKSFTTPKEPTADLSLEEVAPPRLIEVKDNDGDNSKELWQDGGHSIEGSGTPTSLTNYLQELHKKLKHAWSPPPGSIHHIKVLFRLTREGNLASLQLTDSSGNTSADDSALAAINKAAPFGKLPKDFPGQFLDLAYTFNYTTDELHEVH